MLYTTWKTYTRIYLCTLLFLVATPFYLVSSASHSLFHTKSPVNFYAKNSLPEKPIVIVTPSYKNIKWFEKNLQSLLNQKYGNYRILYIDDCSPDGTGEAVRQLLEKKQVHYRQIFFDDSFCENSQEITEKFSQLVNEEKNAFILVCNAHRCGALENLYRAIHSCQDQEIVATVDGDDWLYDDQVLKRLNEAYSGDEVWLSHGCLMEYPWGNVTWCEPVLPEAIEQNSFRKFKCPSHLRTFYAWLFKKIKLEDLLYKGKFFPMAWDMAMMFPMIEMAGERHAYQAKVNYVYNMANQINDNKVDPDLQNELDRFIRNKPPYSRLESREMPSELASQVK